MGRYKTVSDGDVLAAARGIFREHGHAASTRDIARAAGVSQAVLYQRFGSKDHLFFAAMAPSAPDIADMLGPLEPTAAPREYLLQAMERMADYFAEVLPIAIQVMMHPSFDMKTWAKYQHVNAAAQLTEALTRRLQLLEDRGAIAPGSSAPAAGLVTTLAHDWGLRAAMSRNPAASGRTASGMLVELLWRGLSPARDPDRAEKGRPGNARPPAPRKRPAAR